MAVVRLPVSRPAVGTQAPARAAGGLALRALSILAFLALWQALVSANAMWPLQFGNLPSPLQVFRAWGALIGQEAYYVHILISVGRVGAGILLGLVTAVPLGLWVGLSPFASRTVFTILEIYRPIPLIAFLPVVILLFPTTESSILFITFIGAFFPILISTRDAARRVPPVLVTAARCLGGRPSDLLWKVYLPAMAPSICTGLAVGVGASWMGVITAEMISGKHGIGYFSWVSYNLLQHADSIIGMFTIGLLGYASSALVRVLEARLTRSRQG